MQTKDTNDKQLFIILSFFFFLEKAGLFKIVCDCFTEGVWLKSDVTQELIS